jgi:hypothetical protein
MPLYIAVQIENTDTNRRVWLKLPATQEKFAATLETLGESSGNFKIVKYDRRTPGIYTGTLMQAPLCLVNHFASRLNKLSYADKAKLCAIQDSEYAFGFMQQLIEYTYRPDRFTLLPNVMNEVDLGNYHLGNANAAIVGKKERQFIDRYEYGKKLAEDEKGAFTALGYVTSADKWEMEYDDYHIPRSLNLHGRLGEDIYGDYTNCEY